MTEFLAIYGAFLSSLLALLKYLEFRKDRVNIRVKVLGGFRIEPPDHPMNTFGDNSIVKINVVNKGRRPVTITSAGFILPKTKESMVPIKFIEDIRLNENEGNDYLHFEDALKKQNIARNEYVAFASDSTGKIYYSDNFIKRYFKLL